MARVARPSQGGAQVNEGAILVLATLIGAGMAAIITVVILSSRGHFVRFRRVDDPLAKRLDDLTLEMVDLWLELSEVKIGTAKLISQLEAAGIEPDYRLPRRNRRTSPPAADISSVAQFHRLLTDHFNREELGSLAFSVGIPDEGYEGDSRAALALSLVQYASRHGLVNRLLDAARRARPTVDWPAVVGSRD